MTTLSKGLLLALFSMACIAMDLDRELMGATCYGTIQRVQELINAGADVNARDKDGWTALIIAAAWGRKDIAKPLLNYGADTTLREKYGETALDIAREGYNNPYLSQEKQAEYKEVGRILLEAYIEQRKRPLKEAILESKKAEVQKLVAQYPGIPAQEIVKYLKL